MDTIVLDKNYITDLSVGYPIVPPSKIYEDKQATIKIVMANRITPQARPLLITARHEIHLF